MEIPGPSNEPYVAVFNTDTFEGKVYWNGSELIEKDAANLMERIERRYHHDLFFLIAPFMLFDPGVTRTYRADASTETEEVIEVTLPHQEGLPSTTFHLYADRETGRLVRTRYSLPNGENRSYVWIQYQEYAGVQGNIRLATNKRAEGQPFLMVYDRIILPPLVDSDLMTSPTPVLQSVAPEAELQGRRIAGIGGLPVSHCPPLSGQPPESQPNIDHYQASLLPGLRWGWPR